MKCRKGYKYQLAEDEIFDFPIVNTLVIDTEFITVKDSKMTVKRGYAWDGASGPAIDGQTNMTASLFHDAGYQLIRMGVLLIDNKGKLDWVFIDMCKNRGMGKIRSWLYAKTLKKFGSLSCKPGNVKSILKYK